MISLLDEVATEFDELEANYNAKGKTNNGHFPSIGKLSLSRPVAGAWTVDGSK